MTTTRCAAAAVLVLTCVGIVRTSRAADPESEAAAILAATGVRGGLVVQLGCGDGQLAAALGQQASFVVQALDRDSERVMQAREFLSRQGVYGRISAECWQADRLPYVDYSVNLVVVMDGDLVAQDEVLRVLVPRGVAYVRDGSQWRTIVKPLREGVDEWTHFLHDATGNPVAQDEIVGPPRHLQWTAGPRHSRSHEHTPSIQAVVSAHGRVVYLADQGSLETLKDPARWSLIARDAYNGVLLWERPIENWFPHIFGWTQGPQQLQRRLVAVEDRVFVTLGYFAPLSELDAATGQTVRQYPGTEGADEIYWDDGVLVVVVSQVDQDRLTAYEQWEQQARQPNSPLRLRDTRDPVAKVLCAGENRAARSLLVFDAGNGQLLWSLQGGQAQGLKPLSTRISNQRIYLEQRGSLRCCDLRTGELVWAKQADPLRAVSKDALVCLSKRNVTLLAPEDGAERWQQPISLSAVRDVLLVGDSLWLGGGKPYDTGNAKHTGPLWGPYFAVQHDLATGAIVKEITDENPKHHHRCYENKATPNYILGGRRGTELLDLESGDYLSHSWARGTCRYGVMPCNGMIYVPPHACGCYVTVKLMGFNALAPDLPGSSRLAPQESTERGVAFEAARAGSWPAESAPWPTFRGNNQRSGQAAAPVPVQLARKWQAAQLPGATPPVVGPTHVLVAIPEQHEVRALDRATGATAWRFVAGGRVDSPPTLVQGQVCFGCRDGSVYALRASDGQLIWRFRGALADQTIVAHGQVESVAPVHGSVLASQDSVYFVAGRSSYLDDGLIFYRLDARTGQLQVKEKIYSPDPETGQQPEQYGPAAMPGARADILASDGQHIYLRDLAYNLDGIPEPQAAPHLFTLTDYLDDTCAHRSYWIFGTQPSLATGCSGRARDLLFGRVLVFDQDTVYGYGRESVHWSNEFEDGKYRLFARRQDATTPHWNVTCPVHVSAMLLADTVVFAAGAGPAPGRFVETSVSESPLLLAYDTTDGRELARMDLPARPVANGLAAAAGQLVLTLEDGTVLCLGAAQP